MKPVITNPYHLSVITNIIHHTAYKNAPVFYIVKLVMQLFPEYRKQENRQDLIEQIDHLCLQGEK